jgi:large subunit ribosomal protein L21
MFAVIHTGGKQYRVAEGEIFRFEKLTCDLGSTIMFDQVLMVSDGTAPKIGRPLVAGAKVEAEVIEHGRDKKIIVFKKKRRKGYQRKQGHRQDYTAVKIVKIQAA